MIRGGRIVTIATKGPARLLALLSSALPGVISVLLAAYVAYAGFSMQVDAVPFKGEKLTEAERKLIEKAKTKLEGYPASKDLRDMAACITKLLAKGHINREAGKTANKEHGGATKDDGKQGCENDLMNINPSYLVAHETQEALLACVLAHEANHASLSVENKDASEAYAYSKERECLLFLIGRENREEVKKALQDRLTIANKVGLEYAKKVRLADPPGTKFMTKWLHSAGEITDRHQKCAFSVASLDPELSVRQLDVDGPQLFDFPFTVITRPLSLAVADMRDDKRVFVGGTALDDTVGVVEVFEFHTRPTCGVETPSQVLFEEAGVIPASLAIDGATGPVYVLDARGPRIWLLRPGQLPQVVADRSKFPQMEEIQSIGFGPVSPRLAMVRRDQLQGASWAWSADIFSSGDRAFALIDSDGDGVPDSMVGKTVRELVIFEPQFDAIPMDGETSVLVRGTAGSAIQVLDGRRVIGTIVMPLEESAAVTLSRPLLAGETLALEDETEHLKGETVVVSAAVPNILSLEPAVASEAGGEPMTIRGRNFASDSEVFFGSVQVTSMVMGSGTIKVDAIPPLPFGIAPLRPEAVAVQVRSPSSGLSAFADFIYFKEAEFPLLADADGDGVPDLADNCPTVFNPSQQDTGDTDIGDACR